MLLSTPSLLSLILAVSLCHGLRRHADLFRGQLDFIDSILECAYCTGFHSGWMSWLIHCAILGAFPDTGLLQNIGLILTWCFCSAWLCYASDLVFTRVGGVDG